MEYEKLVIEINLANTKRYYLNDKQHRLDGPATEWYDGAKQWHTNNKLHRVDGHAFNWCLAANYHWLNHIAVSLQEREQTLHIETVKLGSINQFIDFVARCDILLL